MDRFLQGLNERQRDAVQAEGNVLITACPGSGKTRVLTRKVGWEVARISNKKRVVAITFTNRAADEIKRRIAEIDTDTKKLWTGTIHSFCLEWLIKPYVGSVPDLMDGFTIIDENESEKLIDTLKRQHGMPRYENIRRTYNVDGTFNVLNRGHLLLLTEYKTILREKKQIDFDDILFYGYRLLCDFPITASRLSNVFSFIAVDEYQDTQELQYAILSEIIKAGYNRTRLFLVGDISQAIYGSIGGVAKSAREISEQFGNIPIQEMELTGNYRSTQRIVDYYANFQITDFNIVAVSDRAHLPGVISYDTDVHKDDIHEEIAQVISRYIEAGVPAKEICVLAPQWWMIFPMGRKLQSTLPDVDFDAYGLTPFRKVKENVWYKLFRLFLSTPGTSNYHTRYMWSAEFLTDLGHFVPHFLNEIENRDRFLLRFVNSFKTEVDGSVEFLYAAVRYFCTGLQIRLEDYPLLTERFESFFQTVESEFGREEYAYATQISTLKRVFNSRNGVVLSTCHGAKGEEYEVVIAYGLLHGYLPNWNEHDAEAAKKLLYVICSRAKENLHLFSEIGHTTRRGQAYDITTELGEVEFEYD